MEADWHQRLHVIAGLGDTNGGYCVIAKQRSELMKSWQSLLWPPEPSINWFQTSGGPSLWVCALWTVGPSQVTFDDPAPLGGEQSSRFAFGLITLFNNYILISYINIKSTYANAIKYAA
jgi:hypothetical protein